MAVLIDTGFPGQIEDLRVAMEKVEVSFDKLKVVILTHQDVDHIGIFLRFCRSVVVMLKFMHTNWISRIFRGETALKRRAP